LATRRTTSLRPTPPGAIGIGVASGHSSKEELHGAGADYVLGSLLEELPGVAEPVA
jgi:phosphoglycolate phosphatase-like HAD superfamily hydrolase